MTAIDRLMVKLGHAKRPYRARRGLKEVLVHPWAAIEDTLVRAEAASYLDAAGRMDRARAEGRAPARTPMRLPTLRARRTGARDWPNVDAFEQALNDHGTSPRELTPSEYEALWQSSDPDMSDDDFGSLLDHVLAVSAALGTPTSKLPYRMSAEYKLLGRGRT